MTIICFDKVVEHGHPAGVSGMSPYDELADLIARNTKQDGIHPTPITRLNLVRLSRPTAPLPTLYQPAVCIVAQGRKQAMFGHTVYVYDRSQYLVVSVDLPIVSQILEASAERPYLCVRLDLDPAMLAALLLEVEPAGPNGENGGSDRPPGFGLALSVLTPELLDAANRLLRLLETPSDIPVLAPLAEREILYRLLSGEQAARLRQIARADSKLQQISRAIRWIKRNYAEPFRIEAVAAEAGMSPSALHQHFKAVTAMSPLQFQKQLRLQEARRIILSQAVDAATAGYRVGYESPSQFSREYSRLFGAPPMRDIARLKTSPDLMFAA
jgi:AraC-like DNA-binding protein